MVMRTLLLLGTLLLAATPSAAQSQARGRATIRIGEIMSLQVRPGGGLAVLSSDGKHRELEDALSLEVFSNRDWQLFVVAEGDARRVAALDGVATPERAVWVRIDGASDGAGYARAERWPIAVAAGARGRSFLAVDYRWLDGPGRELEPGTVLHFTLAPR